MNFRFQVRTIMRVRMTAWFLIVAFQLSNLPYLNSSALHAAEIAVVDSSGNKIPNCEAFWIHGGHPEKLSVDAGILNLPEPVGVVVVRKEGFQYGGLILDPSIQVTELTLLQQLETREANYQTRKHLISPEQREHITDSIRQECWKVVKAPVPTETMPFALQLLAQLSTQDTLDYLRKHRVDPNAAGMARQAAIRKLAEVDLGAALEVLDEVSDPMMRSFLFSEIIKSQSVDQNSTELLEDQMADAIREISQPALRISAWGILGEHYLLHEEDEKVQTIVKEHLEEVRRLPAGGWTGYPRSLFAALLVRDQPDVAAELVEGIDSGNEKARALGRLAFYSDNPETAERLLEKLDKGRLIGYPYISRVAFRLAIKHPHAAIKVANRIPESKHRAWALGLVCLQLSKEDPTRAKEVFANAIDEIEKACKARVRTHVSPGEVMAGLLPLAEAVEPNRLESLVWQSVWAAMPHTRWRDGAESFPLQLQHVAAAVARYDRTLAVALCPEISSGPETLDQQIRFDARAATDRLVLAPEGLPEFLHELGFKLQSFRGFEAIAKLLSAEDDKAWDHVSQPKLLLVPSMRFEEL